jgi:membrane fusion protein, multidrug efflux system
VENIHINDSEMRGKTMQLKKRENGIFFGFTKGSRKNKFPELRRRGAHPARRDDAGLAVPIQGGATPPGWMDRRCKMGSYFFAGPKLANTCLLAMVVLFTFSSCKPSSPGPEPERPLAVRTIAVRTGPIKESIQYVGTVHSRNEIKVLARVAGKVSELPVMEGETAKQGKALAQISAPEMVARVTRLKADVVRAEEESAFLCQQSQLDMTLSKSGAIRKINADASLQKCKSSKAGLKAAKAGLKEIKSLAGNAIERAPFDGKVLNWLTEPGENTMPGRPILMFGDETLEVRVSVHEKDVGAGIQKGTKVIMTLEHSDPVTAEVSFVAPLAMGPGRMVEVRIPVAQGDVNRLQHGRSIDVNFVVREANEAVMIPVNALGKYKSESGVYVVHNNTAQWKPVTASIRENGWVAVAADLKNTDRVVVGNLAVVQDGSVVYPVDFERGEQ